MGNVAAVQEKNLGRRPSFNVSLNTPHRHDAIRDIGSRRPFGLHTIRLLKVRAIDIFQEDLFRSPAMKNRHLIAFMNRNNSGLKVRPRVRDSIDGKREGQQRNCECVFHHVPMLHRDHGMPKQIALICQRLNAALWHIFPPVDIDLTNRGFFKKMAATSYR